MPTDIDIKDAAQSVPGTAPALSALDAEEALDFIFQEVIRLAKLPWEELKEQPSEELFGMIKDSQGRNRFFGSAASQRLWDLTERALEDSPFNRRINADCAYEAIKRGFGREYLDTNFKGSSAEDDRANVTRWLAEAGADCETLTHFIPCHIGIDSERVITVGPVTIKRTKEALERLNAAFERHEAKYGGTEERPGWSGTQRSREYLEAFSEVAEVTVPMCDPKTSKQVAEQAVQAALGFIHLMAGASATRKMRGGGPALRGDQRASVTMREDGELRLSTSSSWEGAFVDDEFWNWLEAEPQAALAQSAATVVDMILSREPLPMMASRYLDATRWYADAAREPVPSAAVVKYLIAMERLLWTGERRNMTKLLSERAAALSFSVEPWDFEELIAQVREAYGLRSGIVHGRITEGDPEISRSFRTCEAVSRELLQVFLMRYGPDFCRDTTVEKLQVHFNCFVDGVWEATRARTRQETVTHDPSELLPIAGQASEAPI